MPRVVIAMSGGVDSSVAAALLLEQGYEVIGIMLRLWSEPGTADSNRCCSPEAMAMARRVASKLGIPFYSIDAQEQFYALVVNYFLDGYTQGVTPNPCLACNRRVRWGYLLQHALEMGADYLATGHYARISTNQSGKFALLRAADPLKDQSYILHILGQDQLSHALFPVGGYTKPQVRELARRFQLPVAERPESQDLCFLAGEDYRQFLARQAPQVETPGSIVSLDGEVLGEHQGLAFYTIGQRKGLGISSPTPLYVIDKDLQHNTLTVGRLDELGRVGLFAHHVHWVAGEAPENAFHAQVKIRYKAQAVEGFVSVLEGDRIRVAFEHSLRDITPGQAAVFYNGDICLGGGIIE